ncbi:MAG: AIR synthase family protein [Symbiobacteriaceae bacterium]|nr:AIR synthase family protein [Symbiobacteriaceae bacterium]
MQTGKLTPEQLQRFIFNSRGVQRPEVLQPSELGEDSAILNLNSQLLVVSTDPITGAVQRAGWLALQVAANDIFANGAEPVGCLLTILAPEGTTPEEIGLIMQDAALAAAELQMEICGGHTEITSAVNRVVLSTTVLGTAPQGRVLRSKDAQAGDAIVLTKYIGQEGASILAKDYGGALQPWFSAAELEQLCKMMDQVSVAAESRLAVQGLVHAMHDVTEGGLLGALYELAEAAGLGFTIDEAMVPQHPLIARLCQILAVDPLRLISSGSLLIATPQGEELVARLQEQGIVSSLLGYFTADSRKILYHPDHVAQEVLPPQGDALWEAMTKLLSMLPC